MRSRNASIRSPESVEAFERIAKRLARLQHLIRRLGMIARRSQASCSQYDVQYGPPKVIKIQGYESVVLIPVIGMQPQMRWLTAVGIVRSPIEQTD